MESVTGVLETGNFEASMWPLFTNCLFSLFAIRLLSLIVSDPICNSEGRALPDLFLFNNLELILAHTFFGLSIMFSKELKKSKSFAFSMIRVTWFLFFGIYFD